jgi:hypothetical protein
VDLSNDVRTLEICVRNLLVERNSVEMAGYPAGKEIVYT